jgi:hypothetical protein
VQFLIVVRDQICQTEIEREKKKYEGNIEQKQIVLMGIDKKKRRRRKKNERERERKGLNLG